MGPAGAAYQLTPPRGRADTESLVALQLQTRAIERGRQFFRFGDHDRCNFCRSFGQRIRIGRPRWGHQAWLRGHPRRRNRFRRGRFPRWLRDRAHFRSTVCVWRIGHSRRLHPRLLPDWAAVISRFVPGVGVDVRWRQGAHRRGRMNVAGRTMIPNLGRWLTANTTGTQRQPRPAQPVSWQHPQSHVIPPENREPFGLGLANAPADPARPVLNDIGLWAC